MCAGLHVATSGGHIAAVVTVVVATVSVFRAFVRFAIGHLCKRHNGNCEQICIPTPDVPRCACWHGFNVDRTGKCGEPSCELISLIY